MLPVSAWRRVLVYLTPLELGCIRCACGLSSHVADWVQHDHDDTATLIAAMFITHMSRYQLDRNDGLTCFSYGDPIWVAGPQVPNAEPYGCGLLTGDSYVATGCAVDPFRSESHLTSTNNREEEIKVETVKMSARQIVPQADAMRAKQQQQPPQPSKTDAVVAATAATSSSSLVLLFQRLRRRRSTPNQLQQRNSWPSTGRRDESLARRAHQSLTTAWVALQRETSVKSSTRSALAPPQFVLRTQRRLSQRFNLKIVQAVGKDVRRSESQRRSSLTMLEAPGSTASLSSSSESSSSCNDDDEFPLRLSERLSLKVGRRISRDFEPMLTEGSALECRVRELVYGLLRNPDTLEGHVCTRFFTKQETFTSPRPAACRYYLGHVRETISDLVQFIVEYRLRELGDEFLPYFEPLDNQLEHHDAAFALELESAVRRAVEEYFCFSLRYEIRQWCSGAADQRPTHFRKTLARWRELPPTSRAFGLKRSDAMLATQPLVATAIAKLHEIETSATPSRKMESLIGACHALSEFITQQAHGDAGTNGKTLQPPPLSPTSRVCLGDADSFLPLLIFAVTRTNLRDAFAQCALLHGLYPFASQHGERMYYLTMFEAALEFIRTHS